MIAPFVATHAIESGAADGSIFPRYAEDAIVATARTNSVAPVPQIESVIPPASDHEVLVSASGDNVRPRIARQEVFARGAVDVLDVPEDIMPRRRSTDPPIQVHLNSEPGQCVVDRISLAPAARRV
jgi:hypothetical protein